MKILALDLATKTGWAIWCDGKILESGVQDFAKRRGESNGIMFLRFRAWLWNVAYKMRPLALVVYEQAHMRGGAATEICMGLQTRAQELAADLGCESVGVHTAALKKFGCGSGRADKSGMMDAAALALGRPPLDDNEADAVVAALWAAAEFGRA